MISKLNMKSLLLLSLLSIIFSFFIIYMYTEHLKEKSISLIINETKNPHNLIKSELNRFKDKKDRLMKMLNEHRLTKKYLNNPTKANKDSLVELFINICKVNYEYMQLRYIDLDGNEKIRVDQNRKGKISIIEEGKLQNKSNRDYFKDFLTLKEGEVGYSEFDLNIENGKLEIPFNPTIRVGYKAYLDKKPQGIFILNIYMQDWIKDVLSTNQFQISIIDSNNYFKTHYDEKWEWSEYSLSKKKFQDYPQYFFFPQWQTSDKEFFILSDNAVARPLKFFGDDVLVSYKLPNSLKYTIYNNLFFLLVTITISSLVVLFPISLIIYKLYNESKRKEKFLQSILNNMFDAIIISKNNHIIYDVNTQAEKLLGYTKEELIGLPTNNLLLHYNSEEFKDEESVVGSAGGVDIISKDGTKIPISLVRTTMKDDGNLYNIKTIRDLRDIKRLEEITKQQQQLLYHQAKLASMGEMIGAIAHQWRQPLNALALNVQNLKYDFIDGLIDEEFINKYIDKNRKTINFMSKTIDDFRNFFRIDKAKIDFDIKESIEAVISMQSAQLKEKNISISLQGESFTFCGYKNEFQQVLLILINNARDAFMEKGIEDCKVDIILGASKLTIKDNAGGIPKDIIEKIFEPYFTTKDEGKGTGMGLYLAKTIIESNMGCLLSVKNDDTGALFTIVFR